MDRMKSTELTVSMTNIILCLYVVYAIFYVPFSGALVSGAVGIMSYGFLESYEATVALTVISGIFFALLTKRTNEEGFADGAAQISERVLGIKKNIAEPGGVFASNFVEGFQNVDTEHTNTNTAAPAANAATATTTTSATSQPANASTTVQTMSMPGVSTAGTAGPANTGQAAPQPAPGAISSGFKSGDGKEPEGLFKLGAIPEDSKGGFHIDQGTTVMNALNALKPDQIQQMSADTQKLIDTQKSLMSMLSTVKPMMQDGKQMMDTFQQMFGGAKGAQPNPF